MSKAARIHEAYHKLTTPQQKVINEQNFTYRIIIKNLNTHLTSIKKLDILDIGSGAGTLALYLASKGHTVLGIDISKNAVHAARTSAKNLKLRNAKFERIEFPREVPKGKYDLVLFTEVIEHLENDNLALQKINSLLRSGGRVFITTPLEKAPLHKLGITEAFDKRVGHLRRYSKLELIKKLKALGFEIVEVYETEGIIRNFLFVNSYAGKLVRFIKYNISDIVTFFDNLSVKAFGASNLMIIARKKS